jgi:predicted ATPase
VQFISDIAKQLFFTSTEDTNFFKNTLSSAIGKDLPILTEMVPILEKIFPKAEFPYQKTEIAPSEAEDRMVRLVRSFMSCIATSERPLVLFIDDLQWSSSAEASVLAGLIASFTTRRSASAIRNCLMILSHRINELSEATAEKIKESLDKLEAQNESGDFQGCVEIQVGPLQLVSRQRGISDCSLILKI